VERLVNLSQLDSGLRSGVFVVLALACTGPLASAVRVRVRRRGSRRPGRLRFVSGVSGALLVAPSRLLPLLGLAFAAVPSRAHAQHAGPPVGAEPWATPPWTRTSGDPPHPPRPLVRSWAPPDVSSDAPPHFPMGAGSFVHPAIHGRTFTPRGRLVPLFPRAAQAHDDSPTTGSTGTAPGARATRSSAPSPDAEDKRSAMAESIRRHPSGKATPAGSSSSRLSSAHRCARGHARASYTVRHGDTLWSIAEQSLRTDDPRSVARYWPKIHRANRDVIGSDPSLIYPGQVLHLPPCDE
jgi:LysM domain